MKKSSILFLALAGSLFIYSCEKKGENKEASTQDTSAMAGKEEKKGLSDKDKEFMQKAAEDNMLEIQLGKLAAEKASSKNVKDYAQMLVTQHEQANEELKQLAGNKEVMLPDSLKEEGQNKLNKLKDKKAKEFDKAYISEMVDEHQKDINKFENEGQKTEDTELKAWIDKTLPHLKHHLETAKQIDSTMKMKQGGKSALSRK